MRNENWAVARKAVAWGRHVTRRFIGRQDKKSCSGLSSSAVTASAVNATVAAEQSAEFPAMAGIHITDIEAAINYWREREPAVDGMALPLPTAALAEVYATMVFARAQEVDESALSPQALEAWMQWYATTPDTPCIAICSTSQGDAECKGCGRTFAEVQHWLSMSPTQKRVVWRRITADGSAWRFNKYAERAAEGVAAPTSSA